MSRNAAPVLMLESGGWGGIGQYTYNLCDALASAGCDVTLQTSAPYELVDLPRRFVLRTWDATATYAERRRAVLDALDATGARVLHMQSTISARRDWMWLRGLRRRGVRLITTAHNILPHDQEERDAVGMRWSFGSIYRHSDRIIAHGRETRDGLVNLFSIPEDRIAITQLGDYRFAIGQHDRAAARAALRLPERARVLLCFGIIREYKGVPDLIDAFGLIAQEFADAHLFIVGKPIRVDIDEYQRKIDALGLGQRIVLRPEYVPLEDVGSYFAACDIAVFPYRRIYQSAALQLAYGAAKPVIATRVGELPSTVRDGDNGLLVAPHDADALAEALRAMLSLPAEELIEMGRRSLELAKTEYGWDDIARDTLAVYNDVISG